MAADFKTAQPIEYYKQFIKENIRPDGRNIDEFRKVFLNVGSINTADGSALVRIGETMMVCGIKTELANPTEKDHDKGFFVPNVQLPPVCSAGIVPGPPSEKAQVLSQQVLDFVTNSGMIDVKELCVAAKKLSYVVYADIICMSDDGNLLDAAFISLLAALQNARLPLVTYDDETGEINTSTTEKFVIPQHNQLVSTSIALFDETILLVDPTREEEGLSNGIITITTGENDQLLSIYKSGGVPIEDDVLKKCIQLALNRRQEIIKLVSNVKRIER